VAGEHLSVDGDRDPEPDPVAGGDPVGLQGVTGQLDQGVPGAGTVVAQVPGLRTRLRVLGGGGAGKGSGVIAMSRFNPPPPTPSGLRTPYPHGIPTSRRKRDCRDQWVVHLRVDDQQRISAVSVMDAEG
jgi:hypothetical protein